MAVLETLIGGVGGGLLRLAPEVLNFFDRKHERKHELSLQDKQRQLVELQGNQRLEQVHVEVAGQQFSQGVSALQEAIKAQATPTGIRWVDAASALVRPSVTYLIVGMWLLSKCAAYAQVVSGGVDWTVGVQTIWAADDLAILAGILNFWFLGRVLDKATR